MSFPRRNPSLYLLLFFSFLTCCLLSADCSFGNDQTVISSERLTYDQAVQTYSARGNVRLEKDDAMLEADEITYDSRTSDVAASGNIRYEDADVTIRAERAELNLETKSGVIYQAQVFYKKDNYRISGGEIRKTGSDYYFSPEATFTTCDGRIPAWCFRGRDMHGEAGDSITARNVTFRIKDVPVLYAPVLWAPILNERKTGLLFPFFGYSDSRGFQLTVPVFWAIAENQDATLVLDEYTRRGLGKGIEYRYAWPGNIEGTWWGYHIEDRELGKDFFELRGNHTQRSTTGPGGYLNINFVNEKDFFREFKTDLHLRTNRFLESTGEIAVPIGNSRGYLLSQYWIDLKEDSEDPAQRLPEAGYVLNPMTAGPFWISGSASLSHFWREEGIHGQRVDLFPKITHAFGDDVTVLQSIGLRETAYALEGGSDDSPHREAFEYHILTHLRLLKKYASFTHIMEPSAGYTFRTSSENTLPVFDSAELWERRSLIELSLLNRILSARGELMVFRISQGFDAERGDRPFLPLSLDAGMSKPLPLRLAASWNAHTGDLERLHSDVSIRIADITLQVGQRYNRVNDVNTYVAGIGLRPFNPLSVNGSVWYDAQQHETREVGLNLLYMSQCWGVNLGFVKRPDDFSFSFLVELKGITKALKI